MNDRQAYAIARAHNAAKRAAMSPAMRALHDADAAWQETYDTLSMDVGRAEAERAADMESRNALLRSMPCIPEVFAILQCDGYMIPADELAALERHAAAVVIEADRDDEPTVYYVFTA